MVGGWWSRLRMGGPSNGQTLRELQETQQVLLDHRHALWVRLIQALRLQFDERRHPGGGPARTLADPAATPDPIDNLLDQPIPALAPPAGSAADSAAAP